MIAYEELERALARWKARRSGVPESAPQAIDEGNLTPPGVAAGAVAYHARENTGELDLTEAELDEI